MPNYSGMWNLVQQLQATAAGNWPAPPFLGWSVGASSITSYNGEPAFDSSGNVYKMTSPGEGAFRITKFDPTGVKIWDKRYFFTTGYSAGGDFIYGRQLSNGDMVFLGQTYTAYYPFVTVMRITPAGAVVACRTFDPIGSGSAAYPRGMAVDSSDNIYISYVYSSYTSLQKLNPSTLSSVWLKWTRGNSTSSNVAVSADGSAIYLCGYSSADSRAFAHKYDSSGNLSVSSTIITAGGSSPNSVGGISVDALGNVFYTLTATDNNSYVVKTDAATLTNYSWAYRTGSSNYGSYLQYSKPDGSGGAFFGNTYAIDFTTSTYFTNISRFSSSGASVFSNTISGNSNSQNFSVDMAQSAIYAVASASSSGIVQKLPITGTGIGIYQGGTSYFSYSGGVSFTSTTLSLSNYTPVTAAYSANETVRSPTVTDQSTTWTTTAFSYPLSSGSALYQLAGSYTWIAPTGVTSVSVLAIGGGGGGGGFASGAGGGGGGLGYLNSQAVTPGTAYTVVVGSGGTGGTSNPSANGTAGGTSSFINASTVAGNGGGAGLTSSGTGGAGGGRVGAGGGNGGAGGGGSSAAGGGGGAGGYAGNGGAGGTATGGSSPVSGAAGSGGGGGGGASGAYQVYSYPCGGVDANYTGGSNGGTVGIIGQGANGAANGGTGSPSTPLSFGRGGGGGGVYQYFAPCCGGASFSFFSGSDGQSGAVRILWGAGRSFPTTNVGAP